ncbi:MAG: glycosyltransferase [bacterium]
MKPIISVILGSYNRLSFLKLTIHSAREELTRINQELKQKTEIIIVDGGSNDGTLEWLYTQKDIITIIQHNRGTWNGQEIERRSWGYFMNLAFKAAQGEYICMLSDDCLVIPNAILNGYKHALTQIKQNKRIGAVAFYFRDWSKEQNYHVGYTLGDKLYVNHGLYLNKALQEVGYIDEENFFFYNADGDLCLKLWHQGYEVIDSPDSYIEHYPHANITIRNTNYAKFKQDLKNFLAKWTGIFYDPKLNNLGKIVEKHFDDQTNTGLNFQQLHSQIATKHPEILKSKSRIQEFAIQLKWKYKAAIRKIRTIFK